MLNLTLCHRADDSSQGRRHCYLTTFNSINLICVPITGHACSLALFLGGSETETDLCSDENDPLKCGEK